VSKARRIRWECPNGLHPGVLGSTRPPRDSVVRYCWPCSQESGRLVERIAPALETKRAAGAQRSAAKRSAKADRDRAAAIAAVSAPVTDSDEPLRVDKVLSEIWALPTRRAEGAQVIPELAVRRGTKSHTSGHCHYGGRIVVTVGRVDTASAVATVIHEVAHEVAYQAGKRRWLKGQAEKRSAGTGHGSLFKSIFRSLVTDYTGVAPPSGEGLDVYDFHCAMEGHIRDVS
jgi:hypothetical protein